MIYFILVNWNGWKDTIECLKSLSYIPDDNFAVVVVDNGSPDGSVERICQWAADQSPVYNNGPWVKFPGLTSRNFDFQVVDTEARADGRKRLITLITAGQNLGFAKANNVGMTFAAADPNCEYYWILNNDTVVAPDALHHLRARMEDSPAVGVLGARLMFYDNPDVVQGQGGWFGYLHARGAHLGAGRQADQPLPEKEVEARQSYVMGASMFIRRNLVDLIGPMATDYFLYFEELDWAERIKRHSTHGYCNDAVVYHKEGGSIGSSSRHRPSDTALYYQSVNLLRYYRKWHSSMLLFPILRLLRESLRHALERDARAISMRLMGITDFFAGRHREGPIKATR